ncbi:MAG: hypothetical protein KDM81_13245 [Verrucomicrobiae bacterium]|nr:hypothetical protein [Verrucomicrobiae bacterium]
MRRNLRYAACFIALLATTWWGARGFNRGFTKTSVPVPVIDEITGIESVDYQPRFVPGIDFLGVSAAAASLLAGSSLLFRKSRSKSNDKTTT